MNLEQALEWVASPDTGAALRQDGDLLLSADGTESFPLVEGRLPLLFPRKLHPYLEGGVLDVPVETIDDPFLKYAHISALKQNVEATNTPHGDYWYQKHYEWTRTLTDGASGRTLDVGCDDAEICRGFFPEDVGYLGLDCLFRDRSKFRVLGMAEFLPVKSASFDCVSFLGSLDHVFDYKLALHEAGRVLKPGGTLYLASLVWSRDYQLHTDAVHFHHFADHELLGALSSYSIQKLDRYAWKDDTHRESLYLAAQKPE